MKREGIINARLAGLIAGLGHRELFMIADGGMPVPRGVEIVDLALCGGVPTFCQVMEAVLGEAEVEGYALALEIQEKNPRMLAYIKGRIPGVEPEFMAHQELKERMKGAKFVIRTGEFTPYSNVMLRAGVAF